MHLLCVDYYTLILETKDDIQRYFHNKLCDTHFFKMKTAAFMGKLSILC